MLQASECLPLALERPRLGVVDAPLWAAVLCGSHIASRQSVVSVIFRRRHDGGKSEGQRGDAH